jgi:2-amino-4-hydroxy-6-hydroxymethyldihydropteridine diphosphokinase
MDIDIIFCGNQIVDSDLLTVPHARWAERRFVVQPLADVRPELVLPGTNEPIRKVLADMSGNDDVRIFSEKW